MNILTQSSDVSFYALSPQNKVERYLLSTPETRVICNDPFVYGVVYTQKLKMGMTKLFKAMREQSLVAGEEAHTLVLHILRGGLNFGLREALFEAYGWNDHSCAFISSQRAHDDAHGWHITENRYQKVKILDQMDLVFADVVATGVSLKHALFRIIELTQMEQKSIRRITFITIGGRKATELLEEADRKCRELFKDYQGSRIIYVEGVFSLPEEVVPLSVAIPGTDLLRLQAELAPDFVKSQSEKLSYALERCVIYDAGSRAFDPEEYWHDVRDYWKKVLALAEKGMTLTRYLRERFPEDPRLKDAEWCKKFDTAEALKEVCAEQMSHSMK